MFRKKKPEVITTETERVVEHPDGTATRESVRETVTVQK